MRWKLAMFLNALTMGVFGLMSAGSQIVLRNRYVQYPSSSECMTLPPISEAALKLHWLYLMVPLLWALMTAAFVALNWKKAEAPRETIQLHTSSTLFVGLLMFFFFALAGILPFISIVVRLGR